MNAPELLPLGLVHGMSNEAYHRMPALSASGLKLMRKSPAHYYGAMLDPARPTREPSPAMRNGTLVHCALFEPAELDARYVVLPAGIDGRTKDGKAALAALAESGREVIDAEQMTTALRQAAAVRELPEVAALLQEGQAEVSASWVDEETGVLCRCRPDWVSPAGDGVVLIDGKTCQDASPDGFSRAIWTYAYHLQAAWYSRGYEQATGLRVHGFVFACVESAWPHAAAAYMLGDDVIEKSAAECRKLTKLYAECKRTGTWPGYPAGVQQINLPRWAQLESE